MAAANVLRVLCLKTGSSQPLDELGPETSDDSSLLCIGACKPTFRILMRVGSTQFQKGLVGHVFPLSECGQPGQLASSLRSESYLWAILGGGLA